MMSVLFNVLITVGQLVFAIGLTLGVCMRVVPCCAVLCWAVSVVRVSRCADCVAQEPSDRWPVMWIGRIIFGFGGESLSVAQSAMIAKWFVGKELALGPSLLLCCSDAARVIDP
jgi:hypothetical protein